MVSNTLPCVLLMPWVPFLNKGVGEEHDPETHVFPLFMRAAKNSTIFKIYGTGSVHPMMGLVRSYIHVLDVAMANYCGIRIFKKGGQI